MLHDERWLCKATPSFYIQVAWINCFKAFVIVNYVITTCLLLYDSNYYLFVDNI